MGTYATATTNVQPRLAGRTLSTGSSPTLAQVDTWVDEGEALVLGTLRAAGISLPVAGAEGGKILTSWICDYAEGHCRQSWVAAIGGGSDDGTDILDRFDKRLEEISANPARFDAMLNGGTASASTTRVRAHVLNNYEGKTITDGDFDPIFEGDSEQEF